MTEEEREVRNLVEEWVRAVDAGDLPGAVARHADDIVMFDVPPPYDGVRGIHAYRDTWPPFLAWQRSGAVFELTTLEVTAGADVAFAHALLRCGSQAELARSPDMRLRLTIGLRKVDGRWSVTHEHHSFPVVSPGPVATASESGSADSARWTGQVAPTRHAERGR